MKKCTTVLLSRKNILLSFCLCTFLCLNAQNPYKKYTDNLPFEMPEVKAPVIPDNKVCVKDFGADPTGISLCTDAFAKAVDALEVPHEVSKGTDKNYNHFFNCGCAFNKRSIHGTSRNRVRAK